MKIKLNITVLSLCLNSLISLATAANVAYIPRIGPGNYAAAGYGKQWPTARFIADVTGNCKIDQLTGLMWAKNASLLGTGPWGSVSTSGTAQYKVEQMNSGSSSDAGYMLCGYNDWRLPNINELKSMINYASTKTGSTPASWLTSQGFSGVQNTYWSSTQKLTSAWLVLLTNGVNGTANASTPLNIWPVRGGK